MRVGYGQPRRERDAPTQAKEISPLAIAGMHVKQRGRAVPEYFNDPAVIELYRHVLTIRRIRQKLFASLPTAQRGNALAQNSVVQAFLDAHRGQVREVITP